MPEEAPSDLSDLDAWRYWKPEAQQKALELLQQAENHHWRPFFCPNPTCDGNPHDNWDFNHARQDQRPPRWSDDWLTLLFSGGRGSGKTRSGSEITHKVTNKVPRIILIGATSYDLRETMIEGLSGILATSPPGQRPEWEPSKKKLTWPNGCIGQGFSAEEPDRLRGPESGFIWGDEPAHWPDVEECWSNMQFGLRLRGFLPKIVATSTPLPTPWMRKLVKDPSTIVRRVSTYANLANLSPVFRKTILEKYEGTRLARQELYGELLEDVEGALWTWDMFQKIDTCPVDITQMVVAVDPAGTANVRSDETGIIVLGIGTDLNIYVFADSTGKYSPQGWASRANTDSETWKSGLIVAENTYGKDMVRFTLENAGYKGALIKTVDSRRGKQIRAEPIVALYEKAKVFHVGEGLLNLEEELTSWVPGLSPSPNRLDALVHGITFLAKHTMPTSIASPRDLFPQQMPYFDRLNQNPFGF